MNPSNPFRVAVFSDVHLAERRLDTERILTNLRRDFSEEAMRGLDMVVIAGDLYDGLLTMDNRLVSPIDLWIAHFLRTCKKLNIAVRVLEGTPSHDRGQSHRFETINAELSRIGADLVYINELTIRYEERFDLNLLFVPDELNHDPATTLAQVQSLLSAQRLTQVDFAFMHGQFRYQLPAHIKIPSHDEHAYLALVKYYIFIGHIHTPSVFERICAQGSYDRTKHNEEEPKGHMRAEVHANGVHSVQFIENVGAHLFVTIDCKGLDAKATLERVLARVQSIPDGNHVRIEVDAANAFAQNMDPLVHARPLLNWTKKEVVAKELEVKTLLDSSLNYEPLYIHAGNVVSLMETRLALSDHSPTTIAAARALLTRFITPA